MTTKTAHDIWTTPADAWEREMRRVDEAHAAIRTVRANVEAAARATGGDPAKTFALLVSDLEAAFRPASAPVALKKAA